MFVRRIVVLVILFFVAACAPTVKGLGPIEDTPPRLLPDAFIAADGALLPLRVWAADAPKAVLIGVHGLNDYSRSFHYPGPWYAARGVSLYAYDQRGFGEAPHPGIWAGSAALRRDLRDFVAAVKARHPGLPVYIAGSSLGGAVTMAAFSDPAAPKVDGLILAAPAVWGWRALNPLFKISLWLSAHITPGVHVTGDGLGIQASDNIEALRENGRDPLFIKETRIDVIYGAVTLMDEAYGRAGELTAPVLLLYGDKDEIIPPGPIEDVAARLPEGGRMVRYEKGWHMLMRDLQRETVWRDMLSWMEVRG